MKHVRKRVPPGASPGTIAVDPTAPRPMLRMMAYGLTECVEQQIHAPEDVHAVHELKGELLSIRRLIWPHREALAQLSRDESPLIEPATRIFFRDSYDHVVQLVDLVETFRELTADLRDFHMTSVSNRINETMRVLTIIATIFIPITFIASIYGMNVDPDASPFNMPELKWYLGYPMGLGLMAATVVGLMIYFVRPGWIRWGASDGTAGS
jgi:magnesium transporter